MTQPSRPLSDGQRWKVLVTGAGALLGQGLIRCLLKSRHVSEIMAVDPDPLAVGLRWAQRSAILPLAADSEYLSVLESYIRSFRPDVVFVGTDVELLILAQNRARLEAAYNVHVVVASPRVVGIADDKYLTFRFLRKHGFAAPDSALVGGHENLVETRGFPLVVKPRVGARSVGVEVVDNWRDLERAIEAVRDPIVQECVATDAEEYTAGTLTFGGDCKAAIVMRRQLRDGNTYRAFVQPLPEMESQVRALATALNAYGPANFQFRLDDGVVKVFEINARFSGTTPLRGHAGFHETELVLRYLLAGEPVTQPTVQEMTILRHWSETIVRAPAMVDA